MPAPMPAPPPQTFGQGPEVISDPAGSIGGTNPVFDMNNLDFSNLDLSNIPGYTPEPGGIESLAPTTPMTAEFVAPTGGIPMPGGGTFDPGMGGEGGAGNYFDNPLFSDPGLGGETGPGRRDNPPPNFTPGLTNGDPGGEGGAGAVPDLLLPIQTLRSPAERHLTQATVCRLHNKQH